MANHDTDIYILGQAIDLLPNRTPDKLTPKEQKELSTAISLYFTYCKVVTNHDPDNRIQSDGLSAIYKNNINIVPELQAIKDFLSKSKGVESKEVEQKPKKEESTVPAELESLVATYKEAQVDQIESDPKHTVADAVKRARKAWERRVVIDNANKKLKEETDRYFIETVDPKSESREAIYRNVKGLAEQAVIAQAASLGVSLTSTQIAQATEDLTYLGLTGSIDLTNYRELNIASQLAFRNQGIDITSPVNELDTAVTDQNKAIQEDPYSDTPDLLDKKINEADEESQRYFNTSTKIFQSKLNQSNLDLDLDMTAAAIEIRNVQDALYKANPNAEFKREPTPLELKQKEFEKFLRLSDPTLQINDTGLGARAGELIRITQSGNRNISPEVVHLYSIGLTPEKFKSFADQAREAYNKDPESSLGKFYASNFNVFKQVNSQLTKLHNSKQGQEIQEGIKPVSGGLTAFYNRNPALQGVTKFVLDPKGTITSWANKQIGRRIGNELLKNTGSALSQKLGNFLLKEGLEGGIKSFAKAGAEKLILAGAKKLGVKVVGGSLATALSALLGISTAGASLLIQAAIILAIEAYKATVGFIKKRLDELWRALGWGDEFKTRDVILGAGAMGGLAAGTGAYITGGLISFRIATQAAAVSALGFIIGSAVFVGVFIGAAFLVAPILSTLVQLDTLEKVEYETYQSEIAPGCGGKWPVKGMVIQGSKTHGGTHDVIEAIDIATTVPALPVKATVDGKVTMDGWGKQYGNWVWVEAKAPDGRTYFIIYAHLMSDRVSINQTVKAGDIIGISDSTSSVPNFRNPHLHLEYRGISYNSCPAGGVKVPNGCIGFAACGSIIAN